MILVSACLLGENCKYSGGNNFCQKAADYVAGQTYLPVCPELLGGLPVPRLPVERQGERAVNKNGQDMTGAFQKGAEAVLALAQQTQPQTILLKEGSPSCGVHRIYDGSFSRRCIPGQGITAELLERNGFLLLSEEDL